MNALPATMRYVAHGSGGAPEVMHIAQGPVPQPKAGEVLIRVAYAGVNRPDVAQRAGSYPPPADASPVLGLEVAGDIVALGEGAPRWRLGDTVCALVPGGGYAEYCTVPAAHCLPIPANVPLEQAAAIPENVFTVWATVFVQGALKAGEGLLVHGGSSGIGLTAIQLAKLRGARVATTVGNDDKRDALKALGADCIVNYREQDFVDALRAANFDVDVVLDMVGGRYAGKHVQLLNYGGRIVQIATLGGAKVEIDAAQLMVKRLTWTGSTMRRRSLAEKAQLAADIERELWPAYADGRVRTIIDTVYPLDEVVAAHRRMESSQHIGKLVLRLR